MVARSLREDRVCFTCLLIDLWKLELKDVFGNESMKKGRFDVVFNAMIEEAEGQGLHYNPIDIPDAL